MCVCVHTDSQIIPKMPDMTSKILRLPAKIWAFKQRLRMLTPLAVIQLPELC